MQQFVPEVLDRNLTDLTVQIWLILHEAVPALQRVVPRETLVELASTADKLKGRMIHVFELGAT